MTSLFWTEGYSRDLGGHNNETEFHPDRLKKGEVRELLLEHQIPGIDLDHDFKFGPVTTIDNLVPNSVFLFHGVNRITDGVHVKRAHGENAFAIPYDTYTGRVGTDIVPTFNNSHSIYGAHPNVHSDNTFRATRVVPIIHDPNPNDEEEISERPTPNDEYNGLGRRTFSNTDMGLGPPGRLEPRYNSFYDMWF